MFIPEGRGNYYLFISRERLAFVFENQRIFMQGFTNQNKLKNYGEAN